MASLKIEPEIIVMQLERTVEALSERVATVEGEVGDDFCDCDCHESDVDNVRGDLEHATKRLDFQEGFMSALQDRISELEALVRGIEAR